MSCAAAMAPIEELYPAAAGVGLATAHRTMSRVAGDITAVETRGDASGAAHAILQLDATFVRSADPARPRGLEIAVGAIEPDGGDRRRFAAPISLNDESLAVGRGAVAAGRRRRCRSAPCRRADTRENSARRTRPSRTGSTSPCASALSRARQRRQSMWRRQPSRGRQGRAGGYRGAFAFGNGRKTAAQDASRALRAKRRRSNGKFGRRAAAVVLSCPRAGARRGS